jgi:GTP pyrophosphokinase
MLENMPEVNATTPQPKVQDLFQSMTFYSPDDKKLVEKAFTFAAEAHKDHKRFSGEPYFIHLFETAKSLAELGMGAKVVAAGLLHDTIEDTKVTAADIEREFDAEVLFLIQGVTKLGQYKYRGLERHTESLRRLLVATSQDVRVLIIKLMDRLHNMKTLSHVPTEKQLRIALETLEIYSPLADRLGMSQLKRELEDLAFQYVDPDKFKEIVEIRKEKRIESEKQSEKIERELKKEFAANNIRKFRMETRIKGLYSLYKKLERKGFDIEKIHDIMALRIIVPTVADCYNVLGIIHFLYRPLLGKIKDYIAVPKPNGYQSLHTTVLVGDGVTMEMQIRTEDMHREATYGIASHMSYKAEVSGERKSSTETNRVWLYQIIPSLLRLTGFSKAKNEERKVDVPDWLAQVAHTDEKEPSHEEFMDALRTDFFSHRVFVFTPKGDVVDLPAASSPIDFAYAIHSDIGNHMNGAKVNGKLVSLDTPLHNGDIVEIITKPSAHPNKKWLDLAKTSLAKRHIRTELQSKSKS